MPVDEGLLHGWFYGNLYVREIAAIGFALLMGTIPFGPVSVWLFSGTDSRLLRLSTGLAPLLDAAKGFLPTAIALHGGGVTVGMWAALAVVIGDAYNPWRRFRGARGSAPAFGALLALCWPAGVIFASVWLVAGISSNYAAVGSLAAAAFTFLPLWYFLGAPGAGLGVAIGLAVAGRYGDSFRRLSEAREPTMRRSGPREPSVVRLRGEPVQSF